MSSSARDGDEWLAEHFHHCTKAKRVLWYPVDRRLSGPHRWSGHGGEKKNLSQLGIYALSTNSNPGTSLTEISKFIT
jgi:hypothetical protein